MGTCHVVGGYKFEGKCWALWDIQVLLGNEMMATYIGGG